MFREGRKRLAYFSFLVDTQNTIFFSQNPNMSILDIDLDLPCNPSAWEAGTAEQWQEFADFESQSPYLHSVLQDYMADTPDAGQTALNALSHILVLYGLIAISWEIQHRNRVDLGIRRCSNLGNLGNQLAASLEMWKAKFDMYRIDFQTSLRSTRLDHGAAVVSQFRSYVGGATVLYHIAHVVLNAPVVEMQKYIGAFSSNDSAHRTHNFDQDGYGLKAWSSGTPASYAIWHAGQAVREAILETDLDGEQGTISLCWSLYLAALVCTLFADLRSEGENAALPGQRDRIALKVPSDYRSDIDEIWVANSTLTFVVSQLTNLGPERIAGAFTAHQARTICLGLKGYVHDIRCQMLLERMGDLAKCILLGHVDNDG
jgi:hypothetical protein